MAEDAKMAKTYSLTTAIKPLFDLLLERLKLQGQTQYVSLSSKVLVKLDQGKLSKQQSASRGESDEKLKGIPIPDWKTQ